MKILVTGGSGLVGKAIEEVSKNYNYEFVFLSSKDGDLRDFVQTHKIFSTHKPDFVIHLAADVGGLFKNITRRVNMLENNLLINTNVLKCSHLFKVKKVISCLSTCIFPENTTYPLTESMLHNGPPHDTNSGYAYSKRILSVQSKAYREEYNDNFICFIPTNVYGKHDNFSLSDGHVIPSLIHKCYLSKQQDLDFEVKGTGTPLRQFIYSIDLAKLIMFVLEEYNETQDIILSVPPEHEVSITNVAEIIANEMKNDKLVFNSKFSDGQHKKTVDNSKLSSLINFEFTQIENGIRDTIKWFIENYDNCRK